MQITKPTKAEVMRELKDYVFITFGLISYAMGWAAFLIPYQITTGGTTGIGAIIYYATGFPIQWSYFIINAVLMTFAIKILGPKFSIKTTFAIFGLTFFLWFFQLLVNGADGVPPQILGPGQDFMACLIGAAMCGAGLGVVFNCNGSTGGTDIIAAIIHKYRDVTLGRMIMACDVIIISSCYFIFNDWRRVIFGFVTLFVIGIVLDYIVKRETTGGSVNLNLSNSPVTSFGNDQVAIRLNHKKSEFGLQYSTRYRDFNASKESVESYIFDNGNQIQRVLTGIPTYVGETTHNTSSTTAWSIPINTILTPHSAIR